MEEKQKQLKAVYTAIHQTLKSVRILADRFIKTVQGCTNKRLALFLKKRGYTIESINGPLYFIKKEIRGKNPIPFVLRNKLSRKRIY